MDAKALEDQLINQIGALEHEKLVLEFLLNGCACRTSLKEKGLVDEKLRLCHTLKKDSGPYFFLELLTIFLADVSTVLTNMTRKLDLPAVDYDHLDELCIKLKGSVSCIGACKMKISCTSLRQSIDNRFKDGCLSALNSMKDEYNELKSKFDALIQLERRIVSQQI